MKQIPLNVVRGKNKGKYFALVDDSEFTLVMKHHWHFHNVPKGHTAYAVTNVSYPSGKRSLITMHRLLMKFPKGKDIDHIDGNGLNNQRSNLRIASRGQNLCNRGKQSNNTTGFKGVSFNKHLRKYDSEITFRGKKFKIGHFTDKIDAAVAHDLWARDIHGEFAFTNFSSVN